MLFGYIASDWLTQIVLIVAVAGVICHFRTMRHVEKGADNERTEKRALAALTTRSSAPGGNTPQGGPRKRLN